MGDEDDRFTLRAQAAKDAEQLIGLCRGQHTCRLVQDQDVGLTVERFEDFHPLLHANANILDQRVGIDVQAVVCGQFH